MSLRRGLHGLFAVVVALTPAVVAAETVMYAIRNGTLVELTLGNTVVDLGPTGFDPHMMASSPDGRLFAVDPGLDLLLILDPATGSGTPVGPLGVDVSSEYAAMTFDAGGQLWMTSEMQLYRVDRDAGAAELVTTMWAEHGSLWNPTGIAFRRGQLYAGNDWLHSVDVSTGEATPTSLELFAGYFTGLAVLDDQLLGLWNWWISPGPGPEHWFLTILRANWETNGLYGLDFVVSGSDPQVSFYGLAVVTRGTSEPAIPDLGLPGAVLFTVLVAGLGVVLVGRPR